MSAGVLMLSLLVWVGATDGGPATSSPTVHAQLSSPKVKLGEPFTLDLRVTHPTEERYELVLPPQGLGDFELLSQTRHREDGPSQSVTRFTLELAAYALGKRPLPTFLLEPAKAKDTGSLDIPPTEVEVMASLPDDASSTTELRDLKPLEPVWVRSYRLLGWLLGTLLTGVLGYLLYRAWKRRSQKALPPAPHKPLHERALLALAALEAEDLPGQGRAREFYFRLSEILRGYLGERFAFEALECTSSEILGWLGMIDPEGRGVVGIDRDLLQAFLLRSDLVKFAKEAAPPKDCARDLAFVRAVVSTPLPPSPFPDDAR